MPYPSSTGAPAAAEDRTHAGEHLLVGLVEGLLELRRDGLAARLQLADLDAQRDHRVELLLGDLLLDARRSERVDLLEDAGDGREVGRLGLRQLGDDRLGIAAEVRDRAAD